MCSSKDDMFPNTTYISPNEEYAFLKKTHIQNCQNTFSVTPNFNYLSTFLNLFQNENAKSNQFSNIIFTNGQFDPWKSGKPVLDQDLERDIVVIDIEKGAHHSELMEEFDDDPISFYKARTTIESYVNKWIGG